MSPKEIAKAGLKGRKKDTFLIKIVIILSFVFIISSTVFQSSVNKTKLEQRLELYGEWHAAYLGENERVVNNLKEEPAIDKLGSSLIIGQSESCGIVGTFNDDLLDMGRFTLHQGSYPQGPNEIMLEINQMGKLNLDLEVGQEIQVDIEIPIVDTTSEGYMMARHMEFNQKDIAGTCIKTHINPSEQIGDVGIIVDSVYTYCYSEEEGASPETIIENGFLEQQKVILKKDFVISGIIQTYTDKWYVGENQIPNALISEEAGQDLVQAFYKTSLYDFSKYEMKHNMFIYSESQGENIYSYLLDKSETFQGDKSKPLRLSEENLARFRRNIFSYPEYTSSAEGILGFLVIGVIFVATALAIFQIFLTQIRRRSRKIVLLKSIGATKAQILKILFYEALDFLKTGIFIGIPLGFGSVTIIILGMNKFAGKNLQFFMEPALIILGIIAGIFALFFGMLIPTIYAIRIPLVGTMAKPPKSRKIRKKDRNQIVFKQNFASINRQYLKVNRNKELISLGISFIAITILLATVFLSYFAFDSYREEVVIKGKPDYIMETFYGDSLEGILETQEDLLAIRGIKSTDYYKLGKQLFFWYENMENNKILTTFDELLPTQIAIEHFSKYDYRLSDQPPWINNGFYTKIYGVNPEEAGFDKYISSITDGEINMEKFKAGEEVILLMPLYLEGASKIQDGALTREEILAYTDKENRMKWVFDEVGAYTMTYNGRYGGFYNKQTCLKPGDRVYLSADNEIIADTGFSTEKIVSHTTKELDVGAIIHYFPEKEIWPFGEDLSAYVIISSIEGMESIYISSKQGLGRVDLEQMESRVQTITPYKFGNTLWHINTKSKSKDALLDAQLISYANRNKGYSLHNYKDSNSQLYESSLNNALIISLLGLTAAAIALIILYNTMVSKIEQDRNRIGILQALGVRKEEFAQNYIKMGIIVGIASLLVIHLLLFSTVFLTSMGDLAEFSPDLPHYIRDIFKYKLIDYPWLLHFLVSLVYLIINTLIYYLPSREIIKKYPVENIRSLAR